MKNNLEKWKELNKKADGLYKEMYKYPEGAKRDSIRKRIQELYTEAEKYMYSYPNKNGTTESDLDQIIIQEINSPSTYNK